MAASSEIEKLERRYAENPDGRYFAPLADAYRKAGQVDRALELVRAGIAKHPDYLSAHIVLGRCLLDKKDDPSAAQAFQSVLGLDPENIIALKSLAEIAERKGELVESREWLQQLLKIDPMNGDAETDLKRLGDAIGEMTTAQIAAVKEEAPAAAPEVSFADLLASAREVEAPVTEASPAETLAMDAAAAAAPAVEAAAAEAPAAEVAPAEAPGVEAAAPAPEFLVPALEAPVAEAVAPVAAIAEAAGLDAGILPPHPPEAPPDAPETPSVVRPSEGIVFSGFVPPQGEVPSQAIDVKPFDDALAWGTGERSSRAISQKDLDAALHEHEASLAGPSTELGVPAGDEHVQAEPIPTEEAWTGGPADDVWEGRASLQLKQVDAESITVDAAADESFDVAEEAPSATESGAAGPEAAAEAAPVGASAEPSGWDAYAMPVAGAEPLAEVPVAEPTPDAAPAAAEAEGSARSSLTDLPIIMPEDVTPPEELARPSGKHVAAAETALAVAAGVPAAAERTPLLTQTMGDLYLRQGFRAEAADVFRRLLERHPDDAGLQAKLAEIEGPPPALGAAALGTESARTWLRRVAHSRVGSPVPAPAAPPEGPSPLEQAFAQPETASEPAGEPARQAPEAFTLDAIFGAAGATTPAAPPPPPPPPTGTSFDEFFGAPPEQGSVRPDPGTSPASPAPEDDVGSFNSWLRGLKR